MAVLPFGFLSCFTFLSFFDDARFSFFTFLSVLGGVLLSFFARFSFFTFFSFGADRSFLPFFARTGGIATGGMEISDAGLLLVNRNPV